MDATALDAVPDDIGALRAALTVALARAEDEAARAARVEAELTVAKAKASDDAALIAHQELTIRKLQRALHGQSSERSARLLDQMELTFEELESTATEDEIAAERAAARTTEVAPYVRKRPARQPFPEHLPRERVVEPAPTACHCCGGNRLRKLGEDVTETLEVVPRQWKVIQHVREKILWATGWQPALPVRVRLSHHPTLELTMHGVAAQSEAAIAIRTDLCAIFVSLELSRSTWLLTSLSPGAGEKMSKHSVSAGDTAGLFSRFAELQQKARTRTGRMFSVITIQEAGLDGFWIHRLLQGEGIESWVVDPASVLTSRRRRRAKTDKIDGETLVRTLLAYKRGEPRVCAMVKAPTPEEEDRRRICRERKTLTAERVTHVNRIKGLLFAQGISDYEPLRRNRRGRLEELGTGDGRPLPAHLKAQISRELDRLEIILAQLKAVGSERDAMLEPAKEGPPTPASLLAQLKGIGPEFAAVLWSEGLFRSFNNRRQVAAYAGLAPTPWQSGSVAHEQGVSKAGNPRLRTTMIQLAWLWLQHQPGSALSVWFRARVQRNGGRGKKTAIVAMARKLLVALWKYAVHGVLIDGMKTKAA